MKNACFGYDNLVVDIGIDVMKKKSSRNTYNSRFNSFLTVQNRRIGKLRWTSGKFYDTNKSVVAARLRGIC